MDLLVMDKEFKVIAVADYFESIIWVDRYKEAGDFEIYTSPNIEIIDSIKQDYYLWNKDSEHVMFIDNMKLTDDVENGNHFVITGHSLEYLLTRRIVWETTKMKGNLQNEVKRVLTENVINPTIADRKIENFIFEDSTDEAITSLSIDEEIEYVGNEIYEVITEICNTFKIGFKITLDSEYHFVFKLYKGIDRSYGQTTNPYVTFSPKFDNLANSNFTENAEHYKTLALVVKDNGEGELRSETQVAISEDTGLERREIYAQYSGDSEDELTEEEFLARMIQFGRETLEDNKVDRTFDCQLEAREMYVYGKDFYLGDTVQVVSGYGMEFRARVTEYTRSYSASGNDIYPSFELLDEFNGGE